jgi:hypothetical protein
MQTKKAGIARTHLAGELLGLDQEVPKVVLECGEVLVLKHA